MKKMTTTTTMDQSTNPKTYEEAVADLRAENEELLEIARNAPERFVQITALPRPLTAQFISHDEHGVVRHSVQCLLVGLDQMGQVHPLIMSIDELNRFVSVYDCPDFECFRSNSDTPIEDIPVVI